MKWRNDLQGMQVIIGKVKGQYPAFPVSVGKVLKVPAYQIVNLINYRDRNVQGVGSFLWRDDFVLNVQVRKICDFIEVWDRKETKPVVFNYGKEQALSSLVFRSVYFFHHKVGNEGLVNTRCNVPVEQLRCFFLPKRDVLGVKKISTLR